MEEFAGLEEGGGVVVGQWEGGFVEGGGVAEGGEGRGRGGGWE